MNVLIVFAHHDPNSFARGMLDRALAVLEQNGHETRVSDLHAMAFKAVADDADFTSPRPEGPSTLTNYQSRQKAAVGSDGFSKDISDEHEKLDWADAVVFIFPYYFFNMPAILKGWCERVIVYGKHYDFDHPDLGSYGTGGFKGMRALIGMSSGAPGPQPGTGPNRHHERIEAMQNGSLNYCGFDVLAPFVAWGVPWIGSEQLGAYMEQWAARLESLFDDAPEIAAADGPTPGPEAITGRMREPGDRLWAYGGDKSIAEKVVMAKLLTDDGDKLVEKLKPYVEAAVADIDARIYSVLRSPDNPGEVWLLEAYSSDEAHQRHRESDPFSQIVSDVGGLLIEPPVITLLCPQVSKGL